MKSNSSFQQSKVRRVYGDHNVEEIDDNQTIKQCGNNQKSYQYQNNRFYQYCVQQISKLARQNKKTTESLASIQSSKHKINTMNQLLIQKTQTLKLNDQTSSKKIAQLQSQLQTYTKQLLSYEEKTQSQLPNKYKQQYLQRKSKHKQNIEKLQRQLEKYQKEILMLERDIQEINIEEQERKQLERQNQMIQEEINRIRVRRMELQGKIYKKNYIVKHLDQVKNLEYQNILKLTTVDELM